MSSVRKSRKTEIGIVTGDRLSKSRRVEVQRLVRHVEYGKYIRQRTVCHAHDEKNESQLGDTVEIMETRPLSKLKRWRVVRVVSQNKEATATQPPAGDASA